MLSSSDKDYAQEWRNNDVVDFDDLDEHITEMCRDRKVVLMIDEVDQISNNSIFLIFLGLLREKFLARQSEDDHTFHSVILAGVYDIKSLKLKMINEGSYTPTSAEGKLLNSPWNIAVDFEVDMAFNPDEIATMLAEYEQDHHTGMDIPLVADIIFEQTSGYPFMVSRICQHIDEKLDRDWTKNGVQQAVNILTLERNVFFDDMSKNLEGNRELYDFLYELLILGDKKIFSTDNPVVEWGSMFGYIKPVKRPGNGNVPGGTVVANKVFEMRMAYYFSSKDQNAARLKGDAGTGLYSQVVKDGVFDMETCLTRFARHYRKLFSDKDLEFLEREGRLLFLAWLEPLVNGHGFYHLESQQTDAKRMDVIVDYGRDQFIIELKLWYGDVAHEKAYEQLLGYMDYMDADRGWLLTFDFRKKKNKDYTAQWVNIRDKQIFDVIV